MNSKSITLLFALPLAFLGLQSLASAEIVTYKATLAGANEVPSNSSNAKGTAVITVDTISKASTYEITYSGFAEGPTAAHIHGPAVAGANGPVLVPLTSADNPLKDLAAGPGTGSSGPVVFGASPVKGTFTISDEQYEAMMKGKTYVNIHTTVFANGEIRGQLAKY